MRQVWRRFSLLIIRCVVAGGLLVSVAACTPGGSGITASSSTDTLAPPTSTLPRGNTNTPSQGIVQGLVEASPTCPVESAEHHCPPKPVPNREVVIKTLQGVFITRMTTDQNGAFTATLAPGAYVLLVPPGSTPFPIQRTSQEVMVVAGQTVQVQVLLDSGIR